MTEEYANEERPSDGEIYQKIRKYRREKQARLEKRWWTRLSLHKASNLRQLFRHNDFTTAFDRFLDLPGVLTRLRISTLHKMFAMKCDEVDSRSSDITKAYILQEVLHYLDYINEFWCELLQGDQSAMARVDQVTVQELQLRAPWASTSDAIILRSKVLGGEVFGLFSQDERDKIWGRLENFRGMIPSLFELFENLKCLEAWADCLRWLIRLDPRETLSMALKSNFSDSNQANDSAIVQESETVFKSVSANAQERLDLGYRQLYSFAMRYHRDIPKRSSRQDLLARPTPTVDTARLREMAELASRLGFESSEITALRQYPRSEACAVATASRRPFLVTDGPGQTKSRRCGVPHLEDYEENRQYLFINHLHDSTDEQGEGVTSFFRFRSMYLKFFGLPDPGPSHNQAVDVTLHTAVAETFPASTTTQVYNSSECDQTHQPEAMSVDGRTSEIITSTQRQLEELSRTDTSQEQEHHHEQFRQRLVQEDDMLKVQEQTQQQLRHRLTSTARVLYEQECTQELRRQKLAEDGNTLKLQEQRFEQLRQQLHTDASVLEEQKQQQERRRHELNEEESALQKQKEERQQLKQQIHLKANVLKKQKQRRRRRRDREDSALKEQEEEYQRPRREIHSNASVLEELNCQEEEPIRHRLTQAQNTHERGSYEASQLMSPEQACVKGRQELSFDANRIQPEDSQERQRKLINDADISEDIKRQEAKRSRAKDKQAELWTSYEREEKLDEEEPNEDQQAYSHEEPRSLHLLDMTHQRGLATTLVPYKTSKEEQSTAPGRLDDKTTIQDPPEISLNLEHYQERIKRPREEIEDSKDEIRARQSERGQKPVTKGRFQRLNNYSNS